MSRIIQEVLNHKFANDRGKYDAAVKIARFLMCKVYEATNFNTIDEFDKFMSIIDFHYRVISSIIVRRIGLPELSERCLSKVMFLHNLMTAIGVNVRRCTKQFFRQWMVEHEYEISYDATLVTEDEQSDLLGLDMISIWLNFNSTFEETQMNDLSKMASIRESISDALWICLKDSITVDMIDRSWHDIKKNIFDYIRQNFNFRNDTEISAIIDAVDKDGCNELMNNVAIYMNQDTFKKKIMNRMKTNVIQNITKLMYSAIDDEVAGLDNTTIADVVNDALVFFTNLTFLKIFNSFDTMFVPLKEILQIVLKTPLKSDTLDAIEKLVTFFVTNRTTTYIRFHVLSMRRVFWKAVSSAQIWIAAAIVKRIGFAVLKSSPSAAAATITATSFREFGRSNNLFEKNEQRRRLLFKHVFALNTDCMMFVREDIMTFHIRSTSRWRLSLRQATYSCLLAEESRRAWTAAGNVHNKNDCDYRNQDRWKKVCIFLDMSEAVRSLFWDSYWII